MDFVNIPSVRIQLRPIILGLSCFLLIGCSVRNNNLGPRQRGSKAQYTYRFDKLEITWPADWSVIGTNAPNALSIGEVRLLSPQGGSELFLLCTVVPRRTPASNLDWRIKSYDIAPASIRIRPSPTWYTYAVISGAAKERLNLLRHVNSRRGDSEVLAIAAIDTEV